MTVPDPFAEALNPQEPEQAPTYGQLLLDLYFCALIKGQGKVVFDPQQHGPSQRRTCVKVGIVPLPETSQQWDIEREFIAEIRSDGWLQVTLPSLRDLSVDDLKALNEQYVKAELVKYGVYTNKHGEERDLTAPKILAVYESREACLAAWEAESAGSGDVDVDDINDDLFGPDPNAPKTTSQATSTNGNGNEAQRRTALQFLPAIVRSCRKSDNSIDTDALATKLAEMPLLKDHFSLESPEVLEEVQKATAEPAF